MTEDDLRRLFQGYDIEEVTIPVNPRTDRPVGYAVVNVTTSKAVKDAIKYLSGKTILERQVSAQLACAPEGTPEAGSALDDEKPARKRNRGRGRGRGKGKAQSPAYVAVRAELQNTTIGGTPGDQTLPQIKIKREEDTKSVPPQMTRRASQTKYHKMTGGTPSTTKVMVRNLS